MEPKEFKELLDQAYTTNNTNGDLSKLLTQVQDTYEQKYSEMLEKQKAHEDITKMNNELLDINEKLRSVNMDLFLKVGSTKPPTNQVPPKDEKPIPITEVYE